MRVLTLGSMYPPHHLGGYELIWADTVAELRRRGHAVRVLASDLRLPGRGDDAPAADVHRDLRRYWEGDRYPELAPHRRLAIERSSAAALDRHLAEHRPDAVAFFSMGGLSLGLIDRVRRAGVPAVGYVADDWLVDGPRLDGWSRAWERRRLLAPLAARVTGVATALDPGAAARWLFISDFTRRRALAAGRPLPRTAVVHAGVHPAFAPAARPPWRWRLLYAGRVDGVKGVDTAIEALAQLPPEATLTIVGADGNPGDVARFARLTRDLGLEGRVHRRTAVGRDELARAHRRADVLLFPSRWEEPWGLVPLEAMACGTPVVATGTGGSAEYLHDGRNCLLAPAGDATAFADAVRRLARDAALRERLHAGGLATAALHPHDEAPSGIARALEELTTHDVEEEDAAA